MKTRIIVFLSILVFIFLCIFISDTVIKYNYPLKYQETISEESKNFGVEKSLIAGVIRAESRFEATAVSQKGAMGLMQLLPSTAKCLAEKLELEMFDDSQLLEPSVNIKLGTYYLSYLQDKFESPEAVLSAYNAGETIVRTWLQNQEYSIDGVSLQKIPYLETKNYVEKVISSLSVYEKLFDK